MEELKSFIRNIPDFPKPGIQFKDVTTLFEDRYGWQMCLDAFEAILRYTPIDKIAGVEARGFVLAAALAGFSAMLWVVSVARSHDPCSWERATEKNRST